MLNRRVGLHAIFMISVRWRGGAASSPLDGASTAAPSPRNDVVHPTHWLISTQVGNTVKRVVIIAAAMLVLGEAMEPVAMVGTTVAIAGVLLYSILKQRLA